MEVILTHFNADFDALGSIIAAQKLYPNAFVVFPGSQERSLRDFLISSAFYLFNLKRLKEVNLLEIKRLIVVDTRQRSRIGVFARLLEKEAVEVHIYDHHPPSPDDFRGNVEVIEPKGANTTIMTRLLREMGIPISKDEATIMLIGIYEDTGSFTFPSTTAEDLREAAFLIELGADLKAVNDIMAREMTPEQIKLLSQMLENAERYHINGSEIVITSASSDEYLQDVAFLVHKLRGMESGDALFVILKMENRVLLIMRSKSSKVDVSKIAIEFGGGGHPTAASATLKNMTPQEVKEKLLKLLPNVVEPRILAKDIMISPLKTIPLQTTLKEAHEIMQKFALGVLPVAENEKFLGLISWEEVEKGVLHGLGERKVSEFMRKEVPLLREETPLWEIYEKIISGNERLLPVIKEDKLVGGVTKSEILRAFEGFATGFTLKEERGRRKNLKTLLEDRLPPFLLQFLRKAGELAIKMEIKAYLVGGFVRDLLTGNKNMDLDIVVEGDAITFSRALAEDLGLHYKVHKAMGTASLFLPEGFKVDVATARIEFYPEPASPPKVERGSLKMDLYRRDFTINALAVDLNPSSFGELIDFFGGQRDLKEKKIRVLHGMSFIEDPARIFRALRFEARFGFRLDRQTESLMKVAINSGVVEKLSGHRLFNELKLILEEPDPLRILSKMEELGLLKVFHPDLNLSIKTKAYLLKTQEVLNWYNLLFLPEKIEPYVVYLLSLTESLKEESKVEFCERLNLGTSLRKKLLDERKKAQKTLWQLKREMDLYKVYESLSPFSVEILLYLMVISEEKKIQKLLSDFVSRLRWIKPELRGKDLKDLGILPGPRYNLIFKRLLEARIKGEVKNREEELELVKREFMDKMVEK
jgi:tRNA nucleotidyltransferase (CCA-adding enzyme)